MRYHYTTIRTTNLQNTDTTKRWGDCRTRASLIVGENMKWKTVW